MELIIIPTGRAPDFYSFNGDVITAVYGEQSEDFDLSALQAGGKFEGVTVDTLPLDGAQIIRDAYRDEQGELHVSLCQQVIAGQYPNKRADWRTGDPVDSADYDPNTCYGVPTGMAGVNDYLIGQGVDVSGSQGWTVYKGVA